MQLYSMTPPTAQELEIVAQRKKRKSLTPSAEILYHRKAVQIAEG
jgi:hypothetical protein